VKGFWSGDEKSKSAGNWIMWSECCEVQWSEVKWSEVKWSEVKELKRRDDLVRNVCIIIDLKLCSCMYVCMFCAVRCIIIIFFFLLFSNYSTHVLLYLFYVCFLVLWCLFSIFVHSLFFYCFCIILRFVFPFVLSLSFFCTSPPTTTTGWKTNGST